MKNTRRLAGFDDPWVVQTSQVHKHLTVRQMVEQNPTTVQHYINRSHGAGRFTPEVINRLNEVLFLLN